MPSIIMEATVAAAMHTERPLLVFDGPGTGKTRMVVYKIVHLVGDRCYRSDQVLALTFSESAAQEMKDRVDSLLLGRAKVSTFHSFCKVLIQEHSLDVGINMTSGIITNEHQKTFPLENLDRVGIESLEVPSRHLRTVSKS